MGLFNIPAFLKSLLGKTYGYILAVIVIVGVFMWWSNHLYEKGQIEERRRNEEVIRKNTELLRDIQSSLNESLYKISVSGEKKIGETKVITVTNHEKIVREIESNTNYSNVDEGISQVMLDSINKTREGVDL